MGGKARKRREKNYLAAHGGSHRLPPPPNSSSIEAIPSKLRKLMSLKGGGKAAIGGQEKNKGDGSRVIEKRLHQGGKLGSKDSDTRRYGEDGKSVAQVPDASDDEVVQNSVHEKKNKKRKRKQVNDLRFETPQELVSSKRKERRKQHSEDRKNKRKGNKKQENVDFPARDHVKFGDVVLAPPKLVVPKAFKSTQNASQERLRIQAVEAYRNRKAWTSRPGIQLPTAVAISP